MTNYLVRPATPDEMPLIMSSWVRSVRADADRRKSDIRMVARGDLLDGERLRAERLLKRCPILVAEIAGVPDEVVSWATCDGATVWAAYTKAPYRGNGAWQAIMHEFGVLPGTVRWGTLSSVVVPWVKTGKAIFDPYARDGVWSDP